MRNIALDLGAKKISFCEVENGKVIRRLTVPGLESLKEVIGPGTPEAMIAFEACREAWFIYDQLEAWGHKPMLVDTTRVRQLGVGARKRKTDRIDAEVMARAVENGTIPLAHKLSRGRQQLRMRLNLRATLVETRSQYVTAIRGIARAEGQEIDTCAPFDFLKALERAHLSEMVTELIKPMRCLLEVLAVQLDAAEEALQRICESEPVIGKLTTATGVGTIVAAAFVSVVDDARRFRNAHQLEAYLGLVPSENSSGDRRRLGSITKHGNCYLRAMLVQAAWCILRSRQDDPLKQWGGAIAERRGKRIAAIAVARRLAGVLWAMWKKGTVYDPAHLAATSATGLRNHAQSIQQQAEAVARAARKTRRRPIHVNNQTAREDAAI